MATLTLQPNRPVTQVRNDSLALYRSEMDEFYKVLNSFAQGDPEFIFVSLAGITARLAQMRAEIVRNEDRSAGSFRTKEIDPLIEECDRQFKLWSRIVSVRTLDWDISKGGM